VAAKGQVPLENLFLGRKGAPTCAPTKNTSPRPRRLAGNRFFSCASADAAKDALHPLAILKPHRGTFLNADQRSGALASIPPRPAPHTHPPSRYPLCAPTTFALRIRVDVAWASAACALSAPLSATPAARRPRTRDPTTGIYRSRLVAFA
jgi:hypothetical protein